MNSKERAALRAAANPLEPIFQIGKEGISENLISQLDDALDARELFKIRVHLETSPKKPRELADELQSLLGAEVIQVIGGVIVLYRKADEEKIKAKKAAAAKKKKPAKKHVKIRGMRSRHAQEETRSRKPYRGGVRSRGERH